MSLSEADIELNPLDPERVALLPAGCPSGGEDSERPGLLPSSGPLDREDSGLPEEIEDVHKQHTQFKVQPLQEQDDNASQEQLPPGSLR